MKIEEKDCKVEHSGECWILYYLKTKTELKEDNSEKYKFGGYFTELHNSFISLILWREHKKYPFKEPTKDLRSKMKKLRIKSDELFYQGQVINRYLLDFKKEVFNGIPKL